MVHHQTSLGAVAVVGMRHDCQLVVAEMVTVRDEEEAGRENVATFEGRDHVQVDADVMTQKRREMLGVPDSRVHYQGADHG